MAVSWLARLAAQAPVGVFAVTGAGARRSVQRLRADERIELVASPRHATVLLVAGALPQDLLGRRCRCTTSSPSRGRSCAGPTMRAGPASTSTSAAPATSLAPSARSTRRCSVATSPAPRRSCPAEHPVPWQGVGPHGHGGEGMMGGTPYGRPLPMPPQEGRDGLALDRLPLTLGPHLAGFPPGLRLRVGLQGDVLEEVSVGDNPFETPRETWDGQRLDLPGTTDLVADRMLRLSELLALAGTDALARRAARLADDPDPAAVARFGRRLRRATTLRWMTRGVGTTDLLGEETDAEARWQRWLDADPAPTVSPLAVLDALPDLLTGAELGEAMTTIATLPIDLEAAARGVEEVAA